MAKRFYSVEHGNDFSSDYGSTRKRDAFKMARELAKDFPFEEIRISVMTPDDVGDWTCDSVIYVRDEYVPPVKDFGEYDYDDLVKTATETGKKIDVDTLGAWFERYGNRYWNGESFKVADGLDLRPILLPGGRNGGAITFGYVFV